MDTRGISIIIPTLNEERYLPLLLDSLKAVSRPLDIIVVDGASTDGTVSVVERYQSSFTGTSSLTLVESQTRGISLQRNSGAAIAKYPILVFCDADVMFSSEGEFENLVTIFIKKNYVLGAPILRYIEKDLRLKIASFMALSAQRMLVIFRLPYFPGSCIITTKRVFTEVGGFDESIALGEDVDYCLRAKRQGAFGLIESTVRISGRRFMKYGYFWIMKEVPNLFRLLFTGKVKAETMFYPFGVFGEDTEKH